MSPAEFAPDLLGASDALVAREISAELLHLNCEAETQRIAAAVRDQVLRRLRRRGVVVGLSGGVDSSVTAALCAAAMGPQKVLGVLMPESESDPESLRLGCLVAEALGIPTVIEEIAPILAASGCYERRNAAIAKIVPGFGPDWVCKVVLPNVLSSVGYAISSLIVESPAGQRQVLRMPLDIYLAVIAAANMKQRTRKQIEYYHADRLNYAVAGTPNRLEFDQGFFVKNGDGAADLKPIAHLYKTQVYALAGHLRVPEEVRRRPPTTDTWTLPQSQEEFYFSLPYDKMDLCLYAHDHGIAAGAVAAVVGLSADQVDRVYRDIRSKRRATAYLHQPPLLVDAITSVGEEN